MSDPPAEQKPRLTYALYGDLINPQKDGVISAEPVKYEMKPKAQEPAVPKKKNAPLQFKPLQRPVQKKGKSKQSGPKFPPTWSGTGTAAGTAATSADAGTADTSSPDPQHSSSTPQQRPSSRGQSFEEFVKGINDEEDDMLYADSHKRKWNGRAGKKHKNKKHKPEQEVKEINWDDIYDPFRATNIADYRGSSEQAAERDDWMRYVHRQNQKLKKKKAKTENSAAKNSMFAPPSNIIPASARSVTPSVGPHHMDIDNDEYHPQLSQPTLGAVPHDQTGEDVLLRRSRMGGIRETPPQEVRQLSRSPSPRPTPAEAAAKLAEWKAKYVQINKGAGTSPATLPTVTASNTNTPLAQPTPLAANDAPHPIPPPAQPKDTSTISKAPVRYNLAESQVDVLLNREDARAQIGSTPVQHSQSPAPIAEGSKMPGQRDFGARMMAKMGWKKGEGLGARGEGITTALIAQPTKRKKRSDGKWSQQIGKIMGGKKNKVQSADDDDFGLISTVVKLQGMLEGLDVAYEIEEKNLMQEIGEQFSTICGPIERLFIWREENGGNDDVFIKFTNQISALNACKGTDGMTFAENAVKARFFSAEKFENGEYA